MIATSAHASTEPAHEAGTNLIEPRQTGPWRRNQRNLVIGSEEGLAVERRSIRSLTRASAASRRNRRSGGRLIHCEGRCVCRAQEDGAHDQSSALLSRDERFDRSRRWAFDFTGILHSLADLRPIPIPSIRCEWCGMMISAGRSISTAIRDTPKCLAILRHAPALLVLIALLSVSSNASAQVDTTAPVLLDFSLEPLVVDVGAADAQLDWCATVRDDLSGLRRATVFVPGTIGSTPARGEVSFSPEGALEQTVCGSLTLARGTPKGPYNVQVFVQDQVLNSVDYVAGDTFGHSGGPLSTSGGVQLLCPIGPCKVVVIP